MDSSRQVPLSPYFFDPEQVFVIGHPQPNKKNGCLLLSSSINSLINKSFLNLLAKSINSVSDDLITLKLEKKNKHPVVYLPVSIMVL